MDPLLEVGRVSVTRICSKDIQSRDWLPIVIYFEIHCQIIRILQLVSKRYWGHQNNKALLYPVEPRCVR